MLVSSQPCPKSRSDCFVARNSGINVAVRVQEHERNCVPHAFYLCQYANNTCASARRHPVGRRSLDVDAVADAAPTSTRSGSVRTCVWLCVFAVDWRRRRTPTPFCTDRMSPHSRTHTHTLCSVSLGAIDAAIKISKSNYRKHAILCHCMLSCVLTNTHTRGHINKPAGALLRARVCSPVHRVVVIVDGRRRRAGPGAGRGLGAVSVDRCVHASKSSSPLSPPRTPNRRSPHAQPPHPPARKSSAASIVAVWQLYALRVCALCLPANASARGVDFCCVISANMASMP